MITVQRFGMLNGSPGLLLALKGEVELITARWVPPSLTLVANHKNIVGFMGPVPVGVLVWQDWEAESTLFVQLSYVLPACRRHGVMKAMWAEVVKIAQEYGRAHIRALTATQNRAMREVAMRLGRVEEAVQTRFDVPNV